MADTTAGDTFNRPPRIQEGVLTGELDIPAPPQKPDDTARNLILMLLPMMGILVMGGFYVFIGFSGGAGRSPLFALPMLAMGVFSITAGLLTYSYQQHQQRQRFTRLRRDYHRLLDRRAARLQAARDLERHLNRLNFPPPADVLARVNGLDLSVWNRRPGDADFAALRLGTGEIPSRVLVKATDPDAAAPDLRRGLDIAFAYRNIPDAGLTLNLLESGSVGVTGRRSETVPFTLALLAQLAAFHAPTELSLYVFASRATYRLWGWTRWLPHTSASQSGGFPNTIAFHDDDVRNQMAELAQRLEQRRDNKDSTDRSLIVVLLDNLSAVKQEVAFDAIIRGHALGVVSLCLVDEVADVPGDCGAIIQVENGRFEAELTGPEGLRFTGRAETINRAQIEILARALANLKLPSLSGSSHIPTSLNFLEMYRVQTINELDIRRRWTERWKERLVGGVLPFEIIIGNATLADPLVFHLAENVHGPHGVLAGTTGSGKSELLRTLVAALAVEHHPYFVNFLLIDYKGGSTFNAFNDLPHTVGNITNLDRIEALRALDAIKSENKRRQRFLSDRHVPDIVAYHKQLEGLDHIPDNWEPLPHLFIIVDEFAELATEMKTFIPELVSTVRVGRSLGVHLILATQRPANHVTDEMRANLQFRICLRVQTAEDSREMLQRPDAAYLPTDVAGRAYFQVGNNTPRQFQVARVNVDYNPDSRPKAELNFVVYERRENLLDDKKKTRTPGDKPPSILDRLIERMVLDYDRELRIPRLPPILLPSLAAEIDLDDVLGRDYGGWDGQMWQPVTRQRRWAAAPIGRLDDLLNREQPPLVADLHGNGGHLLVVGAPGTGKTVLLRTLVMSFARLFTPDEVELYLLSFAGRGLDMLEQLPHVGAVINSEQGERVTRLLHRLARERETRAHALAQLSADNLEQYNQRLLSATAGRRGELTPLPFIIIVIDNFVELKNNHPDEMADVTRLIRDGRQYGLHFVITAAQSNDVPYQIQNLIEQRLALRLNERSEYNLFIGGVGDMEINPRPGGGVWRQQPPLQAQVALPAPGSDDAERARRLEQTVAAMRQAVQQQSLVVAARPVSTLPEVVPLDHAEFADDSVLGQPLLALARSGPPRAEPPFDRLVTPIGLDGVTLKPRLLDWTKDGPHFLINGPVGTGKSSLLKTLVLGATQRYSPDEVRVLIVDFASSLRALSGLRHVVGYVSDEQTLAEHLEQFHRELAWRRGEVERWRAANPDFDEDDAALGFRRLVVVIDDFDQAREAVAQQRAAERLLDLLSAAVRRDSRLGFHLLLAGETSSLKDADPVVKQVKIGRAGFALVSPEAVDKLGGKARRSDRLPNGRGYYVSRSSASLLQFALALEDRETVKAINARWAGYPRASWDARAPVTLAAPPAPPEPPPTPAAAPGASMDFSSFEFDDEGLMADYRAQQGYSQIPDSSDKDES